MTMRRSIKKLGVSKTVQPDAAVDNVDDQGVSSRSVDGGGDDDFDPTLHDQDKDTSAERSESDSSGPVSTRSLDSDEAWAYPESDWGFGPTPATAPEITLTPEIAPAPETRPAATPITAPTQDVPKALRDGQATDFETQADRARSVHVPGARREAARRAAAAAREVHEERPKSARTSEDFDAVGIEAEALPGQEQADPRRVAEQRPAEVRAEALPGEQRAADVRAEALPGERRAADVRAEALPGERRAAEFQAEALPGEQRAADVQAEALPGEQRAAEFQAEALPGQEQADPRRVAEQRAAEVRAEALPGEQRAADVRAEALPGERRAADVRAEALPGERRAADVRAEALPGERRAAEFQAEALPGERRAAEFQAEALPGQEQADPRRGAGQRPAQGIDPDDLKGIQSERAPESATGQEQADPLLGAGEAADVEAAPAALEAGAPKTAEEAEEARKAAVVEAARKAEDTPRWRAGRQRFEIARARELRKSGLSASEASAQASADWDERRATSALKADRVKREMAEKAAAKETAKAYEDTLKSGTPPEGVDYKKWKADYNAWWKERNKVRSAKKQGRAREKANFAKAETARFAAEAAAREAAAADKVAADKAAADKVAADTTAAQDDSPSDTTLSGGPPPDARPDGEQPVTAPETPSSDDGGDADPSGGEDLDGDGIPDGYQDPQPDLTAEQAKAISDRNLAEYGQPLLTDAEIDANKKAYEASEQKRIDAAHQEAADQNLENQLKAIEEINAANQRRGAAQVEVADAERAAALKNAENLKAAAEEINEANQVRGEAQVEVADATRESAQTYVEDLDAANQARSDAQVAAADAEREAAIKNASNLAAAAEEINAANAARGEAQVEVADAEREAAQTNVANLEKAAEEINTANQARADAQVDVADSESDSAQQYVKDLNAANAARAEAQVAAADAERESAITNAENLTAAAAEVNAANAARGEAQAAAADAERESAITNAENLTAAAAEVNAANAARGEAQVTAADAKKSAAEANLEAQQGAAERGNQARLASKAKEDGDTGEKPAPGVAELTESDKQPRSGYTTSPYGGRNAPIGRVEGETHTAAEAVTQVADVAAQVMVPFYDTGTNWKEMSPLERAASLGLDVATLVPGTKSIGALVRQGVPYNQAVKQVGLAYAKGPYTMVRHPLETGKNIGRYADELVNPNTVPQEALELTHGTTRVPVQTFGDPRVTKEATDKLTQDLVQGDRAIVNIDGRNVELVNSPSQRVTGQGVFSSTPNVQHWAVKGGSEGFESAEGQSFFSPSYHGRFATTSAFGGKTEIGGSGGAVWIRDPEIIADLGSSKKTYTPKGGTEVAEVESVLDQPRSYPETSKSLRVWGHENVITVPPKDVQQTYEDLMKAGRQADANKVLKTGKYSEGRLQKVEVIDDPNNPLNTGDLYKLKGQGLIENVKRLDPRFKVLKVADDPDVPHSVQSEFGATPDGSGGRGRDLDVRRVDETLDETSGLAGATQTGRTGLVTQRGDSQVPDVNADSGVQPRDRTPDVDVSGLSGGADPYVDTPTVATSTPTPIYTGEPSDFDDLTTRGAGTAPGETPIVDTPTVATSTPTPIYTGEPSDFDDLTTRGAGTAPGETPIVDTPTVATSTPTPIYTGEPSDFDDLTTRGAGTAPGETPIVDTPTVATSTPTPIYTGEPSDFDDLTTRGAGTAPGETPIVDTPFVTPIVTPVVETPFVTPVVETPFVTPVVETPFVTPIVTPVVETPFVTPVVTPVVETPFVTPVVETPFVTPVVTPVVETPFVTPVVTPVVETPIVTPVVETPFVTPIVTPIIETPIVTPIIETPIVTPIIETPTIETPIVTPIIETPIVTPIIETPTIETPIVTPIIETPIVTPIIETPTIETPIVTPIIETPIVTPIIETPTIETPIVTPIIETPTIETPIVTPIIETPIVTPIIETPTIETPIVTPIIETPIVTPIIETPTIETPIVTPIIETPIVTPIIETPTIETPIVTPIIETPTIETPIVTPIIETPIVTPIIETPIHTPSRTRVVEEIEEEIPTAPRPRAPDSTPQTLEQPPRPAPRPPGSFPRSIEHDERVEYEYDPETGQYDARIIKASRPVITGWDQSPPNREQRAVGTWDVIPGNDGIDAQNAGHETIPDEVKDQLKAESDSTGQPASTTTTVRHEHDLDRNETTTTVARLPRDNSQDDDTSTRASQLLVGTMMSRSRLDSEGRLEVDPAPRERLNGDLLDEPTVTASHRNGVSGTRQRPSRSPSRRDMREEPQLPGKYAALAKQLAAQAKEKKAKRRPRRRSRDDIKERGYKMPEIVITVDGGPMRRIGGL